MEEGKVLDRDERLKTLYENEFLRNQGYAAQSETFSYTRAYDGTPESRRAHRKTYGSKNSGESDLFVTDGKSGAFDPKPSKPARYYNDTDLLITLINAWISENRLEEQGIIVDVLTESIRWDEEGDDRKLLEYVNDGFEPYQAQCANDIANIFKDAHARYKKGGQPDVLVLPLLHGYHHMVYIVDFKNKTCLGFEPYGGTPDYSTEYTHKSREHLRKFEASLRKGGFSTYHSRVKQQKDVVHCGWMVVESVIEVLNGYVKNRNITQEAYGVRPETQKIAYVRPEKNQVDSYSRENHTDLTSSHPRKLGLLKLRLMNLNNRHRGEVGDLTSETMLAHKALIKEVFRELGLEEGSFKNMLNEYKDLDTEQQVAFMQCLEDIDLDQSMLKLFVYFFSDNDQEEPSTEVLTSHIPPQELYPRLFYLYHSVVPAVKDEKKDNFDNKFKKGARVLVDAYLTKQRTERAAAKWSALGRTILWCLLIVPILVSPWIYNYYKQKLMPEDYFSAIGKESVDAARSRKAAELETLDKEGADAIRDRKAEEDESEILDAEDANDVTEQGEVKVVIKTKGLFSKTGALRKMEVTKQEDTKFFIGMKRQINKAEADESVSLYDNEPSSALDMAQSLYRLAPTWTRRHFDEAPRESQAQYQPLFNQVKNVVTEQDHRPASRSNVSLKTK